MRMLLLLAQLAVPRDSASPAALRDLLVRAAEVNRTLADSVRGYRTRVESEIALALLDSAGREHTAQVEQVATAGEWRSDGTWRERVIGYRSESIGSIYSALSFIQGWTLPMPSRQRLSLGATRRKGKGATGIDTLWSVHPLATGRDTVYRFRGGDTVAVLHEASRDIPIVRILVEPIAKPGSKAIAFSGEIELDATRGQLVRMRGTFVRVAEVERAGGGVGVQRVGIRAVAYMELENSEVDGRFWLPSTQRLEYQAAIAMMGEGRSVIHVVARFLDVAPAGAGPTLASADSLHPKHEFAYAPRDSVDHFHDWRFPIGALTANARAADFDDMAPDSWKPTGAPRAELQPRRATELLRYNRVEGLFTGLSGRVRFRDAMPGLTARAWGGVAWSERTVRGGSSLELERGQWSLTARADRALVNTADFLTLQDGDGDQSLGAFFGSRDDADYLDRFTGMLGVRKRFGVHEAARLRVEAGVVRDGALSVALFHNPFRSDSTFRANRPIDAGTALHTVVSLELNPGVSGDFLDRGVGLSLLLDRADGGVRWQRAEARLSARLRPGPFRVALRADGDMVTGSRIAPQAMLELGGDNGLPGYDYKEFGGDRAVLLRAIGGYQFGVLEAPIRLHGRWMIPGLSPGLAVGMQGGWTGLASDAGRASLARLMALTPGGARTTGGMRSTVEALVTFFGGSIGLGVARPLDHQAPWRFTIGSGGTP
ncbi:MAG: hypothetical protein JWO05_1802 [Gemmatimonadetes bacterium]|nr:hypothetical protein [Gemmatimonadota bacterium]